MRKAFLSLLVSVFSMAVHAVEAKLQVWQADGEVVTFDLDEEPVTTYADGNLVNEDSYKDLVKDIDKVICNLSYREGKKIVWRDLRS